MLVWDIYHVTVNVLSLAVVPVTPDWTAKPTTTPGTLIQWPPPHAVPDNPTDRSNAPPSQSPVTWVLLIAAQVHVCRCKKKKLRVIQMASAGVKMLSNWPKIIIRITFIFFIRFLKSIPRDCIITACWQFVRNETFSTDIFRTSKHGENSSC